MYDDDRNVFRCMNSVVWRSWCRWLSIEGVACEEYVDWSKLWLVVEDD